MACLQIQRPAKADLSVNGKHGRGMDNGSSAVGCDVCTPGAVTTVCFGNSRGPQGKSATDLTCCYPHPLRNWHFHRPLSIPRATGWQTMLNIETDWNCRGGEEICYFSETLVSTIQVCEGIYMVPLASVFVLL